MKNPTKSFMDIMDLPGLKERSKPDDSKDDHAVDKEINRLHNEAKQKTGKYHYTKDEFYKLLCEAYDNLGFDPPDRAVSDYKARSIKWVENDEPVRKPVRQPVPKPTKPTKPKDDKKDVGIIDTHPFQRLRYPAMCPYSIELLLSNNAPCKVWGIYAFLTMNCTKATGLSTRMSREHVADILGMNYKTFYHNLNILIDMKLVDVNDQAKERDVEIVFKLPYTMKYENQSSGDG